MFSLFLCRSSQDIGVTCIDDTKHGAVEKLSAGRSQGSVVPSIVVNLRLGKHGQVFHLRLAQVRAVGGNQNELGPSTPEGLDGSLVAQNGLSRFHHQLEPGIHRVGTLFLQILEMDMEGLATQRHQRVE
jgi:hypothetical protein